MAGLTSTRAYRTTVADVLQKCAELVEAGKTLESGYGARATVAADSRYPVFDGVCSRPRHTESFAAAPFSPCFARGQCPPRLVILG